MKAFSFAVILIILAVSVLLSGCTSPQTDPKTAEMKTVAHNLTLSVNNGLGDLKAGLQNNSRSLSTTGLSGEEAEKILSFNLMNYPWAYSSLVVSRDGIVMAAAPKNYAGVIGTNLSGQVQFRTMNTARAPAVTGVFRLVEGFTGVAQSYPIISPSGEYLGYTDITYAPEIFLGRYIEKATIGTGYDVWVVQKDGTEIYDTSKEEIGKNIVTDPVYADPALQKVVSRIVKEPSGTGTYTFWDRDWNRNITKIVVWDTAGIDGAEWRIGVTRAENESITNTPAKPANAGVTTDARYANLTRFVAGAAAYAKEHGKEAALREFNNLNGTFIDGDLYIFAYDMNGTALALPYQKGLLGTSRAGISDSNGVAFIDRMTGIAREGGGPLYYIYPNPEDNYREEFKYSMVVPVDNEWFVGSGIYLPGLPAGFNTTERDELVDRVKQARRYAQVQGAGKAIPDFNDRGGVFANGSRYIFAYGYNGTTLAMPFQPDAIGSNRLNFTDPYGVKVAAWEIFAAKQGGGFVYVDYFNPDTGTEGMKLCYVTPVDNEWLVGSGIYTNRS
ncbi:cache domain-containing protein [uncultured Methanoregula sp.]|uniref:cache domain-containing protein n=1 Tax=uncultured Methanoregula sp. TaxID=1005933 RepID=UPI002AAABBE5|nr:cache domain-containing protein [uncultured Methanoregula sp.]